MTPTKHEMELKTYCTLETKNTVIEGMKNSVNWQIWQDVNLVVLPDNAAVELAYLVQNQEV